MSTQYLTQTAVQQQIDLHVGGMDIEGPTVFSGNVSFPENSILNLNNGTLQRTVQQIIQATSPTTPVTANTHAGVITTQALTTAANGTTTFTVNSFVGASDIVFLTIQDYGGAGILSVRIDNIISGTSFDIVISNCHSSDALDAAAKIGFLLQSNSP